MVLFFSFLIAMFVTMALIPPLMRVAERLQIVDLPNDHKVHLQAIPRVGGMAMVAGTVLPAVLWLWSMPQMTGLLSAMAVILVFGVWDDRADLDYRLKFAGQCVAAVIVWWVGVRVTELPWVGEISTLASLSLTVFALLAITNAVNLADGLDGLAGGSMLLRLATIALLGYMAEHAAVALLAVAVWGSLLGLLLGLPILDTGLVMYLRVREGRSPFSPDKNHIHHRLLAIGLDHYQAVFVIYVVQALLVIAAYYLRNADEAVILGCYALCC